MSRSHLDCGPSEQLGTFFFVFFRRFVRGMEKKNHPQGGDGGMGTVGSVLCCVVWCAGGIWIQCKTMWRKMNIGSSAVITVICPTSVYFICQLNGTHTVITARNATAARLNLDREMLSAECRCSANMLTFCNMMNVVPLLELEQHSEGEENTWGNLTSKPSRSFSFQKQKCVTFLSQNSSGFTTQTSDTSAGITFWNSSSISVWKPWAANAAARVVSAGTLRVFVPAAWAPPSSLCSTETAVRPRSQWNLELYTSHWDRADTMFTYSFLVIKTPSESPQSSLMFTNSNACWLH